MDMSVIFDLIVGALLFFAFIAISSEGFWGASIALFNIAFSALVALNFSDKLAATIAKSADFLSGFADCLSLGGIFAVTLIVLRFATDYLAPGKLRLPAPLESLGKFVAGAAASALLIGFLLVVLQTAPVHKKILWGMYYPGENKPPFGIGLDSLALKFAEGAINGPFKGDTPFDAEAWVSARTAARPYDNTAEEGGATDATGTDPAASPAGSPAGGAPPAQNSPQIPGGTAGAAAGLAPTAP